MHFVWNSVTDFFDQEPVTGGEKIVKNIVEEVFVDQGNPEDWDMMNDDIL